MKYNKKLERLALLQSSYDAMLAQLARRGRIVRPGQYHRPGSIKAR